MCEKPAITKCSACRLELCKRHNIECVCCHEHFCYLPGDHLCYGAHVCSVALARVGGRGLP